MKKLITYKNATWATVVGQAVFMSHALAAPISDVAGAVTVLKNVAKDLLLLFAALATVIIIYAAFLYLTAGGNPARVESAKKTLIWAVIAIALAFVAAGIPPLIESMLSV